MLIPALHTVSIVDDVLHMSCFFLHRIVIEDFARLFLHLDHIFDLMLDILIHLCVIIAK